MYWLFRGVNSPLFSSNQFVVICRTVLIVTLMAHDTGEALLNHLLRDITGLEVSEIGPSNGCRDLRFLVSVSNSSTLSLFIISLRRADEVDVNLDMLADELFAQELSRLLRVSCLARIRGPVWTVA